MLAQAFRAPHVPSWPCPRKSPAGKSVCRGCRKTCSTMPYYVKKHGNSVSVRGAVDRRAGGPGAGRGAGPGAGLLSHPLPQDRQVGLRCCELADRAERITGLRGRGRCPDQLTVPARRRRLLAPRLSTLHMSGWVDALESVRHLARRWPIRCAAVAAVALAATDLVPAGQGRPRPRPQRSQHYRPHIRDSRSRCWSA